MFTRLPLLDWPRTVFTRGFDPRPGPYFCVMLRRFYFIKVRVFYAFDTDSGSKCIDKT